MRLQYLLLMAVATLAATSCTVSAARVVIDSNLRTVASDERVQAIDTVKTEPRSRRFLRTTDTNNIQESQVYNPDKKPVFIEHKLKKTLTDPRKNQKLYERWYNSGFSVKQVDYGLSQNENRDLELTYKNLSLGYAKYFKSRRSQEGK
ncbi:putative secreted RxLR effector protein [Phytophthora cinnamomi]|uniref:putative secreted RxLR effector protein n=1 Tax=Phytophthora cinnamomi TaxID=4785 RepID=UPI002A2E54DE|nr:putative secreted RxLR effector protein [Phytophthora cinnamomi]KAJ8552394.1 hypothetical protein ON010_g10154 [Phytophthora cinnamomi]